MTRNRIRLGYNEEDYNRIFNYRKLLKTNPKIDAMALSMRPVNRRLSEPLNRDRQQPEQRRSLNLPRRVNNNDEIIQFGRNLDYAVEHGHLDIETNRHIGLPPVNQNENLAQNKDNGKKNLIRARNHFYHPTNRLFFISFSLK